jgi:pilus assembly protein CpaC
VAKFLSEPKVITQTGRPARLRAGGTQATLGATNGSGVPGIERIEVGTTVEVLPIVLGTGKIYLEVRPTVRSIY